MMNQKPLSPKDQGSTPIDNEYKKQRQKEAEEKVVCFINRCIVESSPKLKIILVEIEKLFINVTDADLSSKNILRICDMYRDEGWYIKITEFSSFIWRHYIYLSKSPIL